MEGVPPVSDTGAGMQLDINEIQKFLQHRYPFLMIDRIVEMERYKRNLASSIDAIYSNF